MGQAGSQNNKCKNRPFLEEVSGEDALVILRRLANEDKEIAAKIEKIVKEVLSEVDSESIAEEVFWDLSRIEVEELWERSGRTRNEYIEPVEMAWTMIEETLQEYLEQFDRLQRLLMFNQAKECLLGIIMGLYMFDTDSETQFKNWAVDVPEQFAQHIISEWVKLNQDAINDIRELLEERCPNWFL
ncbi:MAG: hypothetical protein AB1497_01580 [Bacillota bacterium]